MIFETDQIIDTLEYPIIPDTYINTHFKALNQAVKARYKSVYLGITPRQIGPPRRFQVITVG